MRSDYGKGQSPESRATCGKAGRLNFLSVLTAHRPECLLVLSVAALAAQSCKKERNATNPVSNQGEEARSSAPVRAETKRRPLLDCKDLDATAQELTRRASICKKSGDCCLIWDDQMMGWDCVAVNAKEDASQLRDGLRELIRSCRREGRECAGLEPVCRHGLCALKGSATGVPVGGWEPLLEGHPHDCRQPYEPAAPELGWNSPEVDLLTDPRLDPSFGIDLPDGGGKVSPMTLEVCVSAEGFVTSARTLMRVDMSNRSFSPMLEAKIRDTWQFRPFVVKGSAKPFCTKVDYPLRR